MSGFIPERILIAPGIEADYLHFPSIDSTNDFLKTYSGSEWCIASSDQQTAGKGRMGRTWVDPPGERVMFSCAFPVSANPSPIPLVAALAAIRALHKVQPNLRLKWPNDILKHGKKVCGILCEKMPDKFIVGIGINFIGNDEEIANLFNGNAAFVVNNPPSASHKELISHIVGEIYQLTKIETKEIVEEWKGFCDNFGQYCKIIDKNHPDISGIFEDLNPEGYPLVRLREGKLITVYAGDMTFKI